MSETANVDSMVDGIVKGQAPEKVRAAAARGALPLPRGTLVRLYVALLEDASESIRQDAGKSLEDLDQPTVQEVLADPECAPEVLGHFARSATRNETVAEKIVFHPSAPRAALAALAVAGSGAVVDLVLTNQERLLASPALLEQLMLNPALRPNQRGRILELLDRASKLASQAQNVAEGADEDTERDPLDEIEDLAELLEVDVGELMARSEIIDGEEFEASEDPQVRSAYHRIVTLNTAQKAILAMKGGREERLILIRDSNKIVSMAVLKNPRVSDKEAVVIAAMRNVAEDVLRMVALKRDWIKHYKVVSSLVFNPRTPPAVATNFIPRLTNRDLKELMRSRDVPELIRRMAKNLHSVRTQPAVNNFRKK